MEIASLTERLAQAQGRLYWVSFEHDRMQERLRDLLTVVPKRAEKEIVGAARYEAERQSKREEEAAR